MSIEELVELHPEMALEEIVAMKNELSVLEMVAMKNNLPVEVIKKVAIGMVCVEKEKVGMGRVWRDR